jgi:hypothetical protein
MPIMGTSHSKGNSMQRKMIFGAALAASFMLLGTAAQAQYAPRQDLDHDGIQNRHDRDRDGDGIPNVSDPNPNRYNRSHVARYAHDMDHDGIADRSDRDIDGDRVPNRRDRHPYDRRRA